jgi:hypothetical protein
MMNWIRQHRPSPGTAFGFTALMVALGGVAFAAIPDSHGTIHGCYQKSNGGLRVVQSAADCKPSEQTLDWNQQGPPGPPGPSSPVDAIGQVRVAEGGSATLAEHGPFTFTARCFRSPPDSPFVGGEVLISTTQEHSAYQAEQPSFDFGPSESPRVLITAGANIDHSTFFAIAPDGTSLTGVIYKIPNYPLGPNNQCVFGGHIIVGGS